MCAIFISSQKFIRFPFRYYWSSKDFPLVILWLLWTLNTVNTWRAFYASSRARILINCYLYALPTFSSFILFVHWCKSMDFVYWKRVHQQPKTQPPQKWKQNNFAFYTQSGFTNKSRWATSNEAAIENYKKIFKHKIQWIIFKTQKIHRNQPNWVV